MTHRSLLAVAISQPSQELLLLTVTHLSKQICLSEVDLVAVFLLALLLESAIEHPLLQEGHQVVII